MDSKVLQNEFSASGREALRRIEAGRLPDSYDAQFLISDIESLASASIKADKLAEFLDVLNADLIVECNRIFDPIFEARSVHHLSNAIEGGTGDPKNYLESIKTLEKRIEAYSAFESEIRELQRMIEKRL